MTKAKAAFDYGRWFTRWGLPAVLLLAAVLLYEWCAPVWRAQPHIIVRVDSTHHFDGWDYYAFGPNACWQAVQPQEARVLKPGDTLWAAPANWTCP